MGISLFNPLGKTYCFRLDAFSCYRCKTGVCSLDDIGLEELDNNCTKIYHEGLAERKDCRDLARAFLGDGVDHAVEVFLKKGCGHYAFIDGQHRICVASKLLQSGKHVKLFAKNLPADEGKCTFCKKTEEVRELRVAYDKANNLQKEILSKEIDSIEQGFFEGIFLYRFDE